MSKRKHPGVVIDVLGHLGMTSANDVQAFSYAQKVIEALKGSTLNEALLALDAVGNTIKEIKKQKDAKKK